MKEVVIVDGVRTPIGNFGGALKDVKAHKLGEVVVKELLKRTHLDPQLVEEVIVGNVAQPSEAANIARN
ncbi:MAG: acetyl-CoA C-acyltransferase, partial [Nitrospira sp.]|nr:acetyl-CoA C-acyltransferase [Nitrospira sp.]